jgi:hypothetical protein
MKKPVYVTLTSIFNRQKSLAITLRSLVEQTLTPDKIYVNLSEEPFKLDEGFKDKEITNEDLRKIVEDPLIEVCWVENYGSHRKIIPTLEKVYDEDCIIVTVDDDTEFHPKLLERLVNKHLETGEQAAMNVLSMDLVGDDLKNFEWDWSRLATRRYQPGWVFNYSVGHAGVTYEPHWFDKEDIFNMDKVKFFPTSDDFTLNYFRIKKGIGCWSANPDMRPGDRYFVPELAIGSALKEEQDVSLSFNINKVFQACHGECDSVERHRFREIVEVFGDIK